MNEEEGIKILKEIFNYYYKEIDDQEDLHIKCDNFIIEFLRKNNYKKIASLYNEISNFFWYS